MFKFIQNLVPKSENKDESLEPRKSKKKQMRSKNSAVYLELPEMTLVQPTGEISAKIREELREPDAETFNKDVAAIREWLEKQPHLPKDMDEGRLRTFLRGCKFSPEKVKQKLDMYYTMRNAVPEFFADRDISRPELAEVLDIADMPPLPGLTPNGCRVVCLRAIERDNMPDNVAHGMKVAMMIGDLRLKMEEVGVAGDVYILDASAATPAQFAKFTPSLVKKFLICVQEAYPVRLKEIHVVNISPLVDKIMTFVKPFLKEKIRDRIFLHSNIEDLYKYVPKEMLPSEYGGGAGPIKNISEQWRNKLKENTQWFKEQESSKANEALRPGGARNPDDLFGMDGTFRQLSID